MVENILKSSLDLTKLEDMPPGKKKTLEAAIILFSKQGYQGTSTLEIAKVAGVSQATVFKYFKTKEELLASILTPVIPKIFSNFLVKLKNIETTEELIHFIVRDRFEFIKENKDTVKIILSEVLTNEKLRDNLLAHIEKTRREKNIDETYRLVFRTKKDINKELTFIEIARSIIGPIMAYFVQRFIILEGVYEGNENHDLELIERQIYKSLTT